MIGVILSVLFLGSCLALPQGGQPVGNPYVKILTLESFQNGADYGHSLTQEDGTSTGQKIGPDGLVYGFYSYIQQGGNPVKVYYRAGAGVGYEVLKVEGLDPAGLGNLRATITQAPPPGTPVERRPAPQTVRRPVQQPKPVVRQPVHHVQPLQLPQIPQVLPRVVPEVITPAPHRFDYPANIQQTRTRTGYQTIFKAL